jgi:hypothetical protein
MQLDEAHSSVRWYEGRVAELEASDAEARIARHAAELAALREAHAAETAELRSQLLAATAKSNGGEGAGESDAAAGGRVVAGRYAAADAEALSSLLYGGDGSDDGSEAGAAAEPSGAGAAPAQHSAAERGSAVGAIACKKCEAVSAELRAAVCAAGVADVAPDAAPEDLAATLVTACACAQAALRDEKMRAQALLYTLEGRCSDDAPATQPPPPIASPSDGASAQQLAGLRREHSDLLARHERDAAALREATAALEVLRSAQDSSAAEQAQQGAAALREVQAALARAEAARENEAAAAAATRDEAHAERARLQEAQARDAAAADAERASVQARASDAAVKLEAATAELAELQGVNKKLLAKLEAAVPVAEARQAVARAKDAAAKEQQVRRLGMLLWCCSMFYTPVPEAPEFMPVLVLLRGHGPALDAWIRDCFVV